MVLQGRHVGHLIRDRHCWTSQQCHPRGPADAGAFGQQPVLRLWEYGVGDTVRRSTSICLRRPDQPAVGARYPGQRLFELEADVDVTLSLKAAGVEVSQDGRTWHELPGQRQGEWIACRIACGRATGQPLRLRLTPVPG